MNPPTEFDQACDAAGIELSGDERDRLGRYLALLLETNHRFNLTGIKDRGEAWMRHVLDALSLGPFIAEAKSVADVGSGGGLPGIPLAIAQPQLAVTLIEATGKKANFCRHAANQLGLKNVNVINDRSETVGRDKHHRGKYDLVVARAVGPMNVLLELTLPLAKVGGRVLAMKGRRAEQELRDCGDALMLLGAGEVEVYQSLPGVDAFADAVIIAVEKASATDRQYPRRPGEPKTNPL